ncbi:MAG: thiol:disulfide interchange protein DsbA/DsbL [Rhodanobacteraceae bacterium]
MLKNFCVLLFGFAFALVAHAADEPWKAGKNYFMVEPPQPTATGAKIEVLEVFSYACPACNQFRTIADKIQSDLPANAEMRHLPASFRSDEDWPVFQRAFFTAQALGVTEKSHNALFDAVWTNGTLKTTDPVTHQLVNPLPTIEDIANFFSKFGVKPADFVATANSFAINTKMKQADAMIKAYGVDSTPTLIINGKYRLTGQSAGGWDKVEPLVRYLIAKESAAP